MAIGPYDKRLKRSRCLNCIARHNKARNCSAHTPCSSCQKVSLVCRYASGTNPIIRLDNRRPLLSSAIVILKTPAIDQQSTFFQHFFQNFLPRNNFSGGDSEWTTYAVSQLSQCHGHYSALSSLGALVSHSHHRGSRHGACVLAQAIQSYQDSVKCLQFWIDRGQDSWDPLKMLSLAFLLSLFELMYDSTGVGWNAHMGFGTSVLLNALGPDSFCAPQSLAIYREIRLFEISRAALFQQSTILASDRWLLFDQARRIASSESPTPLEDAFDLFLKIVILHQRAIEKEDPPASENHTLTTSARTLHSHLTSSTHHLTTTSPPTSPSTNTAHIYHHAMSIYLSGLCDYQVLPSTLNPSLSLPEEEIQYHTESIISRCGKALDECQVSAVLLLLPLRVAGNRCRTLEGRGEVLRLLGRIEGGFGVAGAFRGELMGIWGGREDMA